MQFFEKQGRHRGLHQARECEVPTEIKWIEWQLLTNRIADTAS